MQPTIRPSGFAASAALVAMMLFSGAARLPAQDVLPAAGTEDAVFAPYPSRLRVGLQEKNLLITWEDSPDIQGGYLVYRHDQEPSAANFADAILIGEAADHVQSFSYTPPDDRPYYYLVLGRTPPGSSLGGAYEVFIPLRNASLVPVAFAAPAPAPAVAASAEPAGVSAPPAAAAPSALPKPEKLPVSGIMARNDGDAIVVSFDVEGNPGRIVLYRATEAIRDGAKLLDATVAAILEQSSGPYRDYPVPGINYYYAAVPERELMGGKIAIQSGQNATAVSAVVPAGSYRVGLPSVSPGSRAMPLPYLIISRGLSDAKPVIAEDLTPTPRPLAAETEKAIASLVSSLGSPVSGSQPKIVIFPQDLASPGGGEEYALRLVVVGYLAKGLYIQAAEQFALYLSLPRSAANASLARFYRGQALAASGSYREAFFELLRAQDAYYLECAPWLDYVLERLRRR